ncbi:sulfate ABC transporter permease subunit [Heliobacterium gestii]|uniref:Sulfate ABC transporter permease subunit n=1 Tax=Heliomicrobium gestii TaxID=2699 RepID=A0A845LF62_HELGE|nr:sulfate ABC transporter permease subunit [Heliomicrobium gestii]MBM7866635.1 sulfate transport system permease protein [Heliomicrobium gestii]MZP43085.1 sulfate ABC transporter permease subunit [Heliomicrobium gestii]
MWTVSKNADTPTTIADISGFALRGGVIGYLLLMVVIPLGGLLSQASLGGLAGFFTTLQSPAAVFAFKLTIALGLVTALINSAAGLVIAYGLVRYDLPGKRLLNALVDLPMAIPTAVIGMMLLGLYGLQGLFGRWLTEQKLAIIFDYPGILLALLVVTFPFSIRTVQPLLEAGCSQMEEAAKTLGAGRWHIFWYILLPMIRPGLFSGFTLTFSRAIAEFGAIVLVSGNIPLKTQVASVYIYGLVESSDITGAAVMSVCLLTLSLMMLLLQHRWAQKWGGIRR